MIESTDAQSIDWLATGSSISIVLTADGFTSGHMHVEYGGNNFDYDGDLAGPWSMTRSIVTIDLVAGNVLEDLPFTFDGTRLIGDAVVPSLHRMQITLERVAD